VILNSIGEMQMVYIGDSSGLRVDEILNYAATTQYRPVHV
jgi:hypothetical protein